MPEPARKIEEIVVTVTKKKRTVQEERARALAVEREQTRRRLGEHVTSPHMAGIGGPPREGGKPSADGTGGKPQEPGQGVLGKPGREGAAPETGNIAPPESGEGTKAGEPGQEPGESGQAPGEEAKPEGEPEGEEGPTSPEDRKKALDEQREGAKKEKGEEEEKEKEKGEGKDEEEKPEGRMGGALKRLKEAQKKRTAAKAAGEKVEGMAWKEFYELVNGAGTVSLFGIILVIFVVHVQIWAEFFSLNLEMIPPFEIPLFGDMFPTPLWMKMTGMLFFDFILIVAVIGTLAPIFIPVGWVAKLFGWIIQ